ncbi:unnamed protein product [Tilletia controversa]|uniref:glucan 1,4-alpha-glucosidase n=1 Tax=Tilletia controversa TaxID=13291 RepID=A0A8X7MT96_9BASI|nr:hypothetical protein CF328_g3987 [Tilletia controversa]KAE8247095.1 hypothetical protein A4X06_0g4708 [Tilletia controversa]CAD6903866.1 unnamed protein product [Tilletia controversa]CAD6915912.1 unnamed protein product [Tilletia controversa]CAD6918368.1 unnamed protein product [Tilletia controversa]
MQAVHFLSLLLSCLLGLSSTTPAVRAGTVTADYAFARMLDNIGGASSTSAVPGKNVLRGAVIASPSTASPDYFYSWVRDSAMTMKVVIDSYIKGQHGVTRSLIDNWVGAEYVHQRNAMGSSSSLGEPKFNADGSLFTGPWGRPQNDGPALRATALMKYARTIGLSDPLIASKLYKSDLSQPSLIKSDLEYVAHHWQDPTFDLWEEVQATHFFTLAVQRRALAEGAEFATAMKDPGAASYYTQQASAIQSKLQTFWNASSHRIQAYQSTPASFNRDGLDCAVLLASVHGWNQSSAGAGTNPRWFGPASDRVLATTRQYVDSFRTLYPINKRASAPKSVGVGRYPSDIYDGVATSEGNPWFLCTTTVAEILYDARNLWEKEVGGGLEVNEVNRAFFDQFLGGVGVGRYARGSGTYRKLVGGMVTMADGFMDIVNTHAYANGSLSEEFSRYDGFSVGARDLTWSYAAWLSADAARSGRPVF